MKLGSLVLPHSLELFLFGELDFFSHLCWTEIVDNNVVDQLWIDVEILGELVFQIECENVGSWCSFKCHAGECSLMEPSFESNCEMGAGDRISPCALPIEYQNLASFFHVFHAPAHEDQSCNAIPLSHFHPGSIDIVVLRAHLHVLPLPVAAFLEGHLLAPLLEVAILKFDSVGSDPGEFRRDGITPSFPVAVDLACPFFLLAAVGVAVVRLRCHLLALPNARTAEIVARDIAGLFFDLTVLAPRD